MYALDTSTLGKSVSAKHTNRKRARPPSFSRWLSPLTEYWCSDRVVSVHDPFADCHPQSPRPLRPKKKGGGGGGGGVRGIRGPTAVLLHGPLVWEYYRWIHSHFSGPHLMFHAATPTSAATPCLVWEYYRQGNPWPSYSLLFWRSSHSRFAAIARLCTWAVLGCSDSHTLDPGVRCISTSMDCSR